MATTTLWTFMDGIDHLLDWTGSSSGDDKYIRKFKRAILNAYREVTTMRLWSYAFKRARISTVANYDTGTIAYTHSTRTVTLTGGTWPTWAALGTLLIDNVEYQISSRDSASALTLSVNSNPGVNVASGTSYNLYQDQYTLPVDFTSAGMFKDAENCISLRMVEPDAWMSLHDVALTPSQPDCAAIMASPDYQGVLALFVYPPPDDVYHFDYVYQRQPRQLLTPQYNTGTVTTSGTAVTGTGTAFTAAMVGSVIRFSSSTSVAPTGLAGANPFTEQRIITAVGSGTGLTIDSALTSELTGVKYEISDPIDVEQGAMFSLFLRCCEYELGLMLNKKEDMRALMENKRQAAILAKEADNRSFARASHGGGMSRLPYYLNTDDMQPS